MMIIMNPQIYPSHGEAAKSQLISLLNLISELISIIFNMIVALLIRTMVFCAALQQNDNLELLFLCLLLSHLAGWVEEVVSLFAN